jgi:DNA-binding MarR family transcriptional regulator
MNDHPNAKEFEEAMTNLRRAITAARERKIAGSNFSRTQIEIMILLEHDQISFKHLADKLGLTPGAVTQTVETLVQRNLVERTPDEHDRRSIHLALTNDGKEVVAKMHQARQAKVEALLNSLSQTEIETIIKTTRRLTELIENEQTKNERS